MKFNEYVETSEGNSLYLRWEDGENVIRIVSEPVIVWKSFAADKSVRVYMTHAAAMKDPQAKAKHLFYVIHRKTRALQIAEAGPQIMGKIAKLARTTDYAFDDIPPYDMIVMKTGTGMETEYDVMAARRNSDLTEEEKAKIAALEPLESIISKDAVDIPHP